jgi:ATP-binding cassette, subfamily C (CFTR/MRP), member 1
MKHAGLHIRRVILTTPRAPIRFFSTTDTGQTSNRFSQDLELIDMELPLALIGMTITLISCLAQIGVIIYGSKYIAAAIPGLLILLYFVQMFYLRTSRQLRILDIEAKAPLLSHFIETIHGSVAIRAFGWTEDYLSQNKVLLERSQRPYYLLYCAQRWLNLILDMIVAFLAVILVTIGVITRDSSGALIGLALVNIVGFGISLKGLISNWTNLEVSMGAIARVRHFVSNVESEDQPGEDSPPPDGWPGQGNIMFDTVSTSYE